MTDLSFGIELKKVELIVIGRKAEDSVRGPFLVLALSTDHIHVGNHLRYAVRRFALVLFHHEKNSQRRHSTWY